MSIFGTSWLCSLCGQDLCSLCLEDIKVHSMPAWSVLRSPSKFFLEHCQTPSLSFKIICLQRQLSYLYPLLTVYKEGSSGYSQGNGGSFDNAT